MKILFGILLMMSAAAKAAVQFNASVSLSGLSCVYQAGGGPFAQKTQVGNNRDTIIISGRPAGLILLNHRMASSQGCSPALIDQIHRDNLGSFGFLHDAQVSVVTVKGPPRIISRVKGYIDEEICRQRVTEDLSINLVPGLTLTSRETAEMECL